MYEGCSNALEEVLVLNVLARRIRVLCEVGVREMGGRMAAQTRSVIALF
jgi:hypothetical protein